MKILYGVPGEGMGHATRSKVVIAHLRKNHEVRIVSSGKAFQFLDKHFPGTAMEIRGFHLAISDKGVSRIKTFTETLKQGPKNLVENFHQYRRLTETFMPDLVISDFESFSFLFAKHHRLPLISIDNIQVISRCKLEIPIPEAEKNNFLLAKKIIQAKVPNCEHYLITNFFEAPVRKKNTSLIPPILRPELLERSPRDLGHIIVYQTAMGEKDLVRVLNRMDRERFLVYGYNKDKDYGNVLLKSFSEEGFMTDFTTAKAALANSGFSFTSEAVYLGKPVMSVPIPNQFEQYVNAAYIDKYGYGRIFPQFTADAIKAFLYDLPHFQKRLQQYRQNGNQALYEQLNRLLEELSA